MYIIEGRERLGAQRYGRYIVNFNYPWISNSKFMYLVSYFTSFFPGRIKLMKFKDRGYARVFIEREDTYPYIFMTDDYNTYIDHENSLSTTVKINSHSMTFSLAKIGIDEITKILNDGGFHPEYIIHNEHNPAFIHNYFNSTVIRISTIHDEVKDINIEIITRDNKKRIQMEKIYNNEYRDYFQVITTDEVRGYKFILNVDGTERIFGPDGIDDDKFFNNRSLNFNYKSWWLGGIYYLIFPDSFDKSDTFNNSSSHAYTTPREAKYWGGNLQGVIKRLDYLQNLGIDAIYLTPIYKGSSYHRYDVIDHLTIDPLLGTLEDFLKLIDEAHKRNIKIILDLIVHHTSVYAPMFIDALLNGSKSKYWSWYRFLVTDINEIPKQDYEDLISSIKSTELITVLRKIKPFYESFANNRVMPKLNHENMEVLEYFKDVIRTWLNRGVDGFRVDVAHAAPNEFLRELYNEVKEFGKDKVFIMEINSGLDTYPLGEIADSAMNYDIRKATLNFFLYKTIDAYKFVDIIMNQYLFLPVYVANSLYNLLGSHDTPRIFTLAKNCDECLFNMYTFLFTIYGSPSIYYGDEIGMEGNEDPDCRRPMIWDENLWNKNIFSFIKRLIEVRKQFEVLRTGFFKIRALNKDSIIITRYNNKEEFIVILSRLNDFMNIKLSNDYVEVSHNPKLLYRKLN